MADAQTSPKVTFLSRPHGLARLGFRLPVMLYRLHLGWILDHRFLLLTHRGRVSGFPRQTVLEVVRYDAARRVYTVVAGFGPTSDWYRNLQAHPAIEVRCALQRFRPVQRFLSPVEGAEMLSWYERHHPRAMRMLVRLFRYHYDGTDASRLALATALPMVSFCRQDT